MTLCDPPGSSVHGISQARILEWIELCLTLCNPIDGSLPGSPVPGILQARTLEWVAISFSRGSPWPGDWTLVSFIGQAGSLPLSHQRSLWKGVQELSAERRGNYKKEKRVREGISGEKKSIKEIRKKSREKGRIQNSCRVWVKLKHAPWRKSC